MLGLKLNYVTKRGPCVLSQWDMLYRTTGNTNFLVDITLRINPKCFTEVIFPIKFRLNIFYCIITRAFFTLKTTYNTTLRMAAERIEHMRHIPQLCFIKQHNSFEPIVSLLYVCLTIWKIWTIQGPGGRFKNAYELLKLRALKIPMLYKNRIFQCMSKIFCVEFQRVPLKSTQNILPTHWKM